MTVTHFLLDESGEILEYPPDLAAEVASGSRALPEFADREIPYLQVWVDQEVRDQQLQVRTAGAIIKFDANGRFEEAELPDEHEPDVFRFAHDTCVQLAVAQQFPSAFTVH